MHRICFLLAIIGQHFNVGSSAVPTTTKSYSNLGPGTPACSIDVDYSLVKIHQPVLIEFNGKDYSLASPEKKGKQSVIKVPENSEIIMVCPGAGNRLSVVEDDVVVTTCNLKNQLQSEIGNRKIVGTEKYFCKDQIAPEIRKTSKTCGENSQSIIYEIGFPADAINKWLPMYTVCHDAENWNTIYSMNNIEGKSVSARQTDVRRPPAFLEGNLKELYGSSSPNKYYLKARQVEKFTTLFKPEKIKDYFDMYYRFLSRGHLTPDADMALSSWKVATYMYINVAPQWQMINAGNWLRIENQVRNAAIWSGDDLIIATGTFGVLKLSIGKLQHELYLGPFKKLRVPEQFWKIVYHEKSEKAIVLVTSNNPYGKVKHLCTDVCKKHGWWHENFQDNKNLRRGLTYCCTYEDFTKYVTYAPHFIVKGIYEMPQAPPPPRFYTAVKKVIANIPNNMRWKKKEKEKID